jgi:peptide/nickel transport system substrate-binding protein
VKQACAKAGIDVELKSVVSSVFFSSDVANPDTYTKFYSDLQMYNVGPGAPDPQTFMANFTSAEICSKDNKWARRNATRWRNDDYDRLWNAAESEMDPVKRAALFIRMNDMLTQHVVVIPIVWRNAVAGVSNRIKGNDLSGWDSYLWRLAYWSRQS